MKAPSVETLGGSTLKDVQILDCTLRDGSYAVGFKFSERSIVSILTGLENTGIRLIELGHGLGLGAARSLAKPMLVPDERCFEIASSFLDKAGWGMFCIPGLANLSQVRRAAQAGMKFVRIGVDITDVSPAEEFAFLAKDLGLMTFMNLMKTNVLDTGEVISAVQSCAGYGADVVYLVDSSGSYLPNEVADLFEAVSQAVGIPLGFHGHDNLGLANANALAAASGGARYVDSTLDGIGRGAGNTVTESLAAILASQARGAVYDYRALAELSESVVRPLSRLHDDRVYQVVGGLTRTHSSFFPLLAACASRQDVDVFELMAVVAEQERVNPTEALIMEVASTLAARQAVPASHASRL